MIPAFPRAWREALDPEREKPYFQKLETFVAAERETHTVYPARDEVFTALELTALAEAKVFILGQDPYHGPGQAHGLCFSVRPGIKPPPSLANIYKELKTDLGCHIPDNGYLVPWARQGVLMLNAVLTVRAGEANSHKGRGWEEFTDAVLRRVNEKEEPVVFVLWGGYAAKKAPLIDTGRHTIVRTAHPSPLSAHNGFFGSRPFSKINELLQENGNAPIDWQIPNLQTQP
jgi:uracil-DNA glycosylase